MAYSAPPAGIDSEYVCSRFVDRPGTAGDIYARAETTLATGASMQKLIVAGWVASLGYDTAAKLKAEIVTLQDGDQDGWPWSNVATGDQITAWDLMKVMVRASINNLCSALARHFGEKLEIADGNLTPTWLESANRAGAEMVAWCNANGYTAYGPNTSLHGAASSRGAAQLQTAEGMCIIAAVCAGYQAVRETQLFYENLLRADRGGSPQVFSYITTSVVQVPERTRPGFVGKNGATDGVDSLVYVYEPPNGERVAICVISDVTGSTNDNHNLYDDILAAYPELLVNTSPRFTPENMEANIPGATLQQYRSGKLSDCYQDIAEQVPAVLGQPYRVHKGGAGRLYYDGADPGPVLTGVDGDNYDQFTAGEAGWKIDRPANAKVLTDTWFLGVVKKTAFTGAQRPIAIGIGTPTTTEYLRVEEIDSTSDGPTRNSLGGVADTNFQRGSRSQENPTSVLSFAVDDDTHFMSRGGGGDPEYLGALSFPKGALVDPGTDPITLGMWADETGNEANGWQLMESYLLTFTAEANFADQVKRAMFDQHGQDMAAKWINEPAPPQPATGTAPLAGMTQPIGPRNLTGGGGLAT